MKNICITTFLFFILFELSAQDLIVHQNDGNKAIFPINTIDSITFVTGESESGTFTDNRDGNEYGWVKIGNQIWMTENLAYLPAVYPDDQENASYTEARYYVYGYDGTSVSEAKNETNYQQYGALYNFEATKTAAPEGWHVPTDEEWQDLEMFLGMSADATEDLGTRTSGEVGKKLKCPTGWDNDTSGENLYNFCALAGGHFVGNGSASILDQACFWTATEKSNDRAWWRNVYAGSDGVFRNHIGKHHAQSIRCVKDQ